MLKWASRGNSEIFGVKCNNEIDYLALLKLRSLHMNSGKHPGGLEGIPGIWKQIIWTN